jgi:hypothetical protein
MKAQPKSKAVLFSPWFILFISSSDHLHFPQGNDYSLFALISANSILLETFLWVVWFNPSNPQSPFKIKPLVHRASSSWEVIFQCDFFSWDVQCAYAELQKVSPSKFACFHGQIWGNLRNLYWKKNWSPSSPWFSGILMIHVLYLYYYIKHLRIGESIFYHGIFYYIYFIP